MKLNWNFLGEGGAKQKPFHGGGMDILWNCTINMLFGVLLNDRCRHFTHCLHFSKPRTMQVLVKYLCVLSTKTPNKVYVLQLSLVRAISRGMTCVNKFLVIETRPSRYLFLHNGHKWKDKQDILFLQQ